MFSLLLHPAPEGADLLIADLLECGTAGIAEEPGGLRAFFENAQDAAAPALAEALLRRFAEFAPQLREEEPVDWERATQDAWPPLCVGDRFYLVAPWHASIAAPPGRLRLAIYPGMACGTGRHPATQLCLRAIERYVQPGARVLDVGSGSGILSEAARLMGAACVIGCDVDPSAVSVARERGGVALFVGSADAVRSQWADVIVANIDSATIESIAAELARVRSLESTLILSGFPEWEIPESFAPRQILQQEEWRCLIC